MKNQKKKAQRQSTAPIQHHNHSNKTDGICLLLFIASFACMVAGIPNLKLIGAGVAFAVLLITTHDNLNNTED